MKRIFYILLLISSIANAQTKDHYGLVRIDSVYGKTKYQTGPQLTMRVEDTLTGKAYHQAIPSTATITSGNYTPTLTNTQNVAGSTAYACQWMRIGNIVTVSGKVDITATASATQTYLQISMPTSTANFTAFQQVAGVIAPFGGGSTAAGSIEALTSSQTAEVDLVPTSTTATKYSFTFTYTVQ
jgi:hypothetical protein